MCLYVSSDLVHFLFEPTIHHNCTLMNMHWITSALSDNDYLLDSLLHYHEVTRPSGYNRTVKKISKRFIAGLPLSCKKQKLKGRC